MMKRVVLFVVVVLWALASSAQTAATVNYKPDVASVKAALVAKGMDLSGPCGAFAIVKRVAWLHRAEGAGLLSKPSGNNCDGYATDIVAFPDGSIADAIGDGGGENKPAWQVGESVEPSRWRAAIDPGDEAVTPVEPSTGTVDLGPLTAQVEALRAEVDALTVRLAALEAKPIPTIVCEDVEIPSSRSWGHNHKVKVPVCKVQP